MAESTSTPMTEQPPFVELTAEIVAAYVAKNSVPVAELPALLSSVHAAIAGLNGASVSSEPKAEKLTPAQIRKSITPNALISFIDGKPYKTLKRHLTGNGLTIEEYRQRFGLPVDYPSTAASYSAMRAEFARRNGLGQRRKAVPEVAEVTEIVVEAPKDRGRKKVAEPAAAPAEKHARTRKPKKVAVASD